MSELQFYKLPNTLREDMDKFFIEIKGYQTKEIPETKFKGLRVAHGIYEQRKFETYMVRIRCVGGAVTPAQLKQVGVLSRQWGSGEVHVTTRQDLQLHYVPLEHIPQVCDDLVAVGISPRGGGGNTVRNVLSSHDSGVLKDEVFDVLPYARALTSRMLDEPDSWNLPRKFKIAFCNQSSDNVRAAITCMGFFAKIKDQKKGFAVYCGGGMGSLPQLGNVLFDFVEEDKVYHIVKAMKIMFDKYGNRRNRNQAKLKFLWKKLGKDEFIKKFNKEYDKLIAIEGLSLVLPSLENEASVKDGYEPISVPVGQEKGFETWRERHVSEQKQEGLYQVCVPLKLGDLQAKETIIVAEEMENFGENSIRLSVNQNMYFRNIPEAYLPNLFVMLQKIDTLSNEMKMFSSMVACTGADTCKLGIALPRGVTPRIQERLKESSLDLDRLDVKVHISGCPNTCGGHHSADIGFFGRVLRSQKDMLPGYNVLVGAIMEEGKSRFARKVGEVPAKRVPDFVKDCLTLYEKKHDKYSSFATYVDAEGEDEIKALCEKHSETPTFEEEPHFFYDWGSLERFSLLKGQKAECSAGMFDMIDIDVKNIKDETRTFEESENLEEKESCIQRILFLSARMLLVTRGIEVKEDKDVYRMFKQHFIRSHIVSEEYLSLIENGEKERVKDIYDRRDQVLEFAAVMQKLYKEMDDSLRFPALEKTDALQQEGALTFAQEKIENAQGEAKEYFKDLRGVGCPINFVKVKLELAKMQSGDTLMVFLDEGEPIKNVPASVKLEGHNVISEEPQGDHWMVKIEKK